MDLVEPDDGASVEDRLRDRLLAHGLPPEDLDLCLSIALAADGARWWPNGCVQPLPSEDERLDSFVRVVSGALRDGGTTPERRVRLLRSLVASGVVVGADGQVCVDASALKSRTGPPVVRALLPHLRRAGTDLRRCFELLTANDGWIRDEIAAAVESRAVLRAEDQIDRADLRSWTRFATRDGGHPNDPRRADFWLRVRGIDGLDELLTVVKAEPPNSAGRVASAILHSLKHPVWQPDSASPPAAAASTLQSALQRWCDHLAALVDADPADVDSLGAYLDAVTQLGAAGDDALPEFERRRATRVAHRALGRLRVVARDPSTTLRQSTGFTALEEQLAWSAAVGVLARSDGLGSALVAGTLLLRALHEPAVARDLRWWDEAPLDAPPARWRWLPSSLVAVVHSVGAREERTDPELRAAREQFSLHLLDRLKPAQGKQVPDGPREVDASWRRCCIRAARELAINPAGKGHQILYNVAQSDSDAGVRDAATIACDELRRVDGSTGDISPRRRLVAALWWLRQAHLLALGIDIDAIGARRTRQMEISRTTEKRTTSG